MTFSKLIKSFQYALRGFVYVVRHEQSFRLQLVASVVVIVLMYYFHVTIKEAIILWLVIGAVLVLELINTIFENLLDLLQPRMHHLAQVIKDIMAAAVLLASLGALIIGLLVFLPYVTA